MDEVVQAYIFYLQSISIQFNQTNKQTTIVE